MERAGARALDARHIAGLPSVGLSLQGRAHSPSAATRGCAEGRDGQVDWPLRSGASREAIRAEAQALSAPLLDATGINRRSAFLRLL